MVGHAGILALEREVHWHHLYTATNRCGWLYKSGVSWTGLFFRKEISAQGALLSSDVFYAKGRKHTAGQSFMTFSYRILWGLPTELQLFDAQWENPCGMLNPATYCKQCNLNCQDDLETIDHILAMLSLRSYSLPIRWTAVHRSYRM